MAAAKGNQYARGHGRPTDYKSEYDQQAYKLCLLSATDREIADFFGVQEQTLNNWKGIYPSFFESLKEGKQKADSQVADRLYQRAMGYEHAEDEIFMHKGKPVIVKTMKYYPPDPTSAIFWLKNRQPQKWRDKREVEQTTTIDLSLLTPDELDLVTSLTEKLEQG